MGLKRYIRAPVRDEELRHIISSYGSRARVVEHASIARARPQPLVMRKIDVPASLLLAEDTHDIAVENIELVGTTVEGIIRARKQPPAPSVGGHLP
jgi:hypothetical protein